MKYKTWFVLVLVCEEWKYVADERYSNLEFTRYMALAKSFGNKESAQKIRAGYIALNIQSRVTLSKFTKGE